MLQLHSLLAKIQLTAAAECPIDEADGDLGREAQSVRRRRSGGTTLYPRCNANSSTSRSAKGG